MTPKTSLFLLLLTPLLSRGADCVVLTRDQYLTLANQAATANTYMEGISQQLTRLSQSYQSRLSTLESQVSTLASHNKALQQKLSVLEGLQQRLTSLEGEFSRLSAISTETRERSLDTSDEVNILHERIRERPPNRELIIQALRGTTLRVRRPAALTNHDAGL